MEDTALARLPGSAPPVYQPLLTWAGLFYHLRRHSLQDWFAVTIVNHPLVQGEDILLWPNSQHGSGQEDQWGIEKPGSSQEAPSNSKKKWCPIEATLRTSFTDAYKDGVFIIPNADVMERAEVCFKLTM